MAGGRGERIKSCNDGNNNSQSIAEYYCGDCVKETKVS